MLPFDLTEGQERLLAKRVNPDAETLRREAAIANQNRIIPPDSLKVLGRYYDLLVPEAYGGQGADSLTYALVLAHLAMGNPSVALLASMHGFAVSEFALTDDPEVHQRFFALAKGHAFSAGVSEKQSKGHRLESFVPKDLVAEPLPGGGYKLNGMKRVVSGYRQSQYVIVYAHLAGTERTTICLVVPRNSVGMREGREWDKMNFMRSTNSNSVTFSNVAVNPEGYVLETDHFLGGAVGVHGPRTFAYLAVYHGILTRQLELAKQIIADRGVGRDKQVAEALHDCHVAVDGGWLLIRRTAELYDRQDPTATMYMMRAKTAVDKAIAACVPILRTHIGSTGMANPEWQRLEDDCRSSSVMPPNTPVAGWTGGYLAQGLNPLEAVND